ncbi:MAG: hypothetical protein ABWY18_08550 [Tardiphaga sp.]
MSKISSLVLGLVSGAAMFGAIQYASGNDLRGTLTDGGIAASSRTVSDTVVNRSGKGDRAAVAASAGEASQTLSFRVHGLSDTSVLLKLAANPVVPAKIQTGKALPVSVTDKPQKSAVACEPPVSVLTEVARLMQPGRCVT